MTGATGKSFVCKSFMCLFCSLSTLCFLTPYLNLPDTVMRCLGLGRSGISHPQRGRSGWGGHATPPESLEGQARDRHKNINLQVRSPLA